MRIRAVIGHAVVLCVAPDKRARRTDDRADAFLASDTRGSVRDVLRRQIAIYLAHVAAGLSYKAAGEMFGRDRTTAAHACARIEDVRENERFDHIITLLEHAVRLGLTQVAVRTPQSCNFARGS